MQDLRIDRTNETKQAGPAASESVNDTVEDARGGLLLLYIPRNQAGGTEPGANQSADVGRKDDPGVPWEPVEKGDGEYETGAPDGQAREELQAQAGQEEVHRPSVRLRPVHRPSVRLRPIRRRRRAAAHRSKHTWHGRPREAPIECCQTKRNPQKVVTCQRGSETRPSPIDSAETSACARVGTSRVDHDGSQGGLQASPCDRIDHGAAPLARCSTAALRSPRKLDAGSGRTRGPTT